MMSGRGLGHTGGTLDKLESIAGFDINLSEQHFKDILRNTGCAIVSTTAEMAPVGVDLLMWCGVVWCGVVWSVVE